MKIIRGNKTPIFLAVLFALLPLVLNFIFTGLYFINFGGWESNFQKNLTYLAFFLANWPSLLLKIEDLYLGFSLKLFIFNALGWGLVGFIVGFLLRRFREKS